MKRMKEEIPKLDLHRVRHEEVEHLVIRFIESHWNSGVEELEIITGNSESMKVIVSDILDDYNLDYSFGRKFDLNNRGYIVIWL